MLTRFDHWHIVGRKSTTIPGAEHGDGAPDPDIHTDTHTQSQQHISRPSLHLSDSDEDSSYIARTFRHTHRHTDVVGDASGPGGVKGVTEAAGGHGGAAEDASGGAAGEVSSSFFAGDRTSGASGDYNGLSNGGDHGGSRRAMCANDDLRPKPAENVCKVARAFTNRIPFNYSRRAQKQPGVVRSKLCRDAFDRLVTRDETHPQFFCEFYSPMRVCKFI